MKPPRLRVPKLERPSPGWIILWSAAIVLAVIAFNVTRDFVAAWQITEMPGVAIEDSDPETAPTESNNDPLPEVAAPEVNLPPAWDGASRVTLLFIGLDARDWEIGSGAPRSDTMILFTIDPISRTAGMLSIPRDIWTNIPGFGYSRINTAYSMGEAYKLPGGGPAMAVKTVEQFIGVPIQYYAQVDFKAFEEAIDAIGGVYLCVPEKIKIDPIGPKPPTVINKGCQTLHGYQVLGYVRNRHTSGGDIDRANRQQQVIMALVDQVFSPQNFPTMVTKAPKIYDEAQAGLRTNLSFTDALKLGSLLSQIPAENIKSGVIDYSMAVLDSVIVDGKKASILKPFPDQIRVLRDEIFTASGALSPMAAGDPATLMQAEAANMRVLNGAWTDGLAEQTANYLIAQGMQVTETGKADHVYDRTVVVLYGPKLYTLRYLYTVFGMNAPYQVLFEPDPASTVDVEIRIGNDWLALLP
ncbi:MAG: LCP family protein [Chloroflexota bacterium]